MPVDLDDQLAALGDAMLRESEPILIGELTQRRDTIPSPRVRTKRRRWAAAAAMATAVASVVAIVVVGGGSQGTGVSTIPAVDQEFAPGVLGLDPTSPIAARWQVTGIADSLDASWGAIVTRRYTIDSPTPESGPALDVATFLDGMIMPGVSADGPTIDVNGAKAGWLDLEQHVRGLAFSVDGRWFVVRGYRTTDQQIITAAEHTSVAPDGVGAVVDPAGLPDGVVEQFLAGGMSEWWPLPVDLSGDDVPTVRWTDGDRIVWLLSVPRDDAFVRSLRVASSTIADTTVGDAPSFVATWEAQPNLLWMGWSDASSSYLLGSNELSADELVGFADALRPMPVERWTELVNASRPRPEELVPIGVDRFPFVDDDVVPISGQLGTYGIFAGPAGERAYPTLQLWPDITDVAVLPEGLDVVTAGWDEATATTLRDRPAAIGATGDILHVAIDLPGRETLLVSSPAERSADDLLALASAVELVDEAVWQDRYEAIRPVIESDGPPNTQPVPTTAAHSSTVLRRGDTGDEVAALQGRLTALGFDPGPADGVFGEATEQAVWAFEKIVLGVPRDQATGVVTPEMWERMQGPVAVTPRRPQDDGVDHVEIYLPEQVLVVFDGDQPVLVTHVSTGMLDDAGEPAEYCETITIDNDEQGNPLDEPEQRSICGYSKTPGGIFDVDRFVAGTRNGPLGSMWNPLYFNYGLAIHGARNVPLQPVSHGNVRVPMHVAERLPDLIPVGSSVYVWDGETEPEDQTRESELPSFPYPAPSTPP